MRRCAPASVCWCPSAAAARWAWSWRSTSQPQVALERIKPLVHVFRDEPALESDVIELLRFSAEYYHYPIGQVVMGALPQLLRRARLPEGARAFVPTG